MWHVLIILPFDQHKMNCPDAMRASKSFTAYEHIEQSILKAFLFWLSRRLVRPYVCTV